MPSLTLLALSPQLLSAALAAAAAGTTAVPVPPAPEITPLAWGLAAAHEAPLPPEPAPPEPAPPEPALPASSDPGDPANPDAEPPIGEIVVQGDYGPPAADPMERINEDSYRISQAVDRALVEPLAYAYRDGVPEPIRDGLGNVVRNLGEPSNALNFLMQGKVGKAFGTLGRLAINSTIGVGGLFDVAGKPRIGLPYHRNGFANTMGFYGVGPGPYLYLPGTGATTVRDLAGRMLDQLVLPLAVGRPFNQTEFAASYFVINGLDQRLEFDAELAAIEASGDPYLQRRETYLERRQRDIAALKGEVVAEEEGREPEALAAAPAEPAPPREGAAVEPPQNPEALLITHPR